MEKKITGKESLELEKNISGKERRKQILELIRQSVVPLSGAKLGQLTGVSRQVVVQDIALLRTEGHEIISTARGYILPAEEKCVSRKFKVYHTDERMEEELDTIVDLGGAVQDVMVNHRTYGKVSAELQIRSRPGCTELSGADPQRQIHAASSNYIRLPFSYRERGERRNYG